MTSPTPEENERLARLADSIERLNESTIKQMVRQAKMSQSNRRMIWTLAASFALDVVLTIALALGLFQLNNQSSELDEVTSRLDTAQTTQRQKALCPLYQLFKDSWDTPKEREIGRARSNDPENYDRAIRTIDESYKALNCSEFKGDPLGLKR